VDKTMLLMKKCYFDAIRGGTKTTTLRYWLRARIRPGSVHRVPGLGRVHVQDVEAVEPASLCELDAQADGFASLQAMWSALEGMYPPTHREGRKLYRVRFTFLG
jgi:hypothetical protein